MTKITKATALLIFSQMMIGCASIIDPIDRQIAETEAENVLSVQGYLVRGSAEEQQLLKRWESLSDLMRQKPGFVSARLGEGTGQSNFWFAYSEWRDVEAVRTAFSDQEVVDAEEQMPDRLFGHLYQRVGEALPEK